MAGKSGSAPREPLFARRARVERQLEQQREELAVQWRGLEAAAYIQERRIVGITRGFRAVVPLGAMAGVVWLLRRYGPARLAQPVMLALSGWNFARRLIPWRHLLHRKDGNGKQATSWLPLAISILGSFVKRRRGANERRQDVTRTRAAPYRGGRRHGGLRRQP